MLEGQLQLTPQPGAVSQPPLWGGRMWLTHRCRQALPGTSLRASSITAQGELHTVGINKHVPNPATTDRHHGRPERDEPRGLGP